MKVEKMKQFTSTTQRMQVIRDLCVMSTATGKTSEVKRAVLNSIAERLEISSSFVCQSLEQDPEPD